MRNARDRYEALTLSDEYMASSIAQYLTHPPTAQLTAAAASTEPAGGAPSTSAAAAAAAGAASNARMVVLAGSRHVRGRVGVPNRFSRRTAEPTFSMIPQTVAWADTGLPAIERPLSGKEADWVLYTQGQITNTASRQGGLYNSAAGAAPSGVITSPRLSSQLLRSMPLFEM